MKYSIFIYGRTRNIDFRVICNAQNNITPNAENLAKQLINTDTPSNGDINRVRYLFVREHNQVVFGIGFSHKDFLPKELHTDSSNRRILRSFIGIVIANDEFETLESIPISPEFYVEKYKKIVTPIWDLEDKLKNKKLIISKKYHCESSNDWICLNGNISFNDNEKICRFFPLSEESKILASLKKCESSIAIGLNIEGHVVTAFRRFNVHIANAICIDTLNIHDYELFSKSLKNGRESLSIAVKEQNLTDTHSTNAKIGNDKKLKSDVVYTPNVTAFLDSQKPASINNPSVQDKSISSTDSTLMTIDWGEGPESSDLIDELKQSGRTELDDIYKNKLFHDSQVSCDDEKKEVKVSKKGFRLKLILVFMILIITLIILVCKTCQKSHLNHQQSISGDTIQQLQPQKNSVN